MLCSFWVARSARLLHCRQGACSATFSRPQCLVVRLVASERCERLQTWSTLKVAGNSPNPLMHEPVLLLRRPLKPSLTGKTRPLSNLARQHRLAADTAHNANILLESAVGKSSAEAAEEHSQAVAQGLDNQHWPEAASTSSVSNPSVSRVVQYRSRRAICGRPVSQYQSLDSQHQQSLAQLQHSQKLPELLNALTQQPKHDTVLKREQLVDRWRQPGQEAVSTHTLETDVTNKRAREAQALLARALAAASSTATAGQSGRVDRDDDEALDIAFSQLPHNWDKRDLDWSASAIPPLAEAPKWGSALAANNTEIIRVERDGKLLSVLPLWICIHQEQEFGPARLYESILPLSEEVVSAMERPLNQFAAVAGLNYTKNCDQVLGSWHNFFIGVVGDVASEETDVLWPNQVLHGERTMYNVRNGLDLARFLADPVKEDIEAHLENLRRLQEERQYRSGWCYFMLQSRWGLQALKDLSLAA